MYLGDLTKIQSTEILEDIKGKVVLVGYTGINDPFPTEQDLFDAHSTPLGKMFGVGILANILHTLMGNMICDVPLFLMVLILFMLVLIGAWSVVFAVNRVRYSYWCIKAFQLLTVVLLFILASVLIHHAVLLDFELLVNALILLPEAAYWELKLLR